jgi:glucose/arabinose dehydrogenase
VSTQQRLAGAAVFICATALIIGCGGGSSNSGGIYSLYNATTPSPTSQPTTGVAGQCSGAKASTFTTGMTPTTPALTVPGGLVIQTIANVGGAREMVGLPNGDLLVGTNGNNVYIIPNAEASGAAGAPQVFATISNETVPPGEPNSGNNAEGVAFSQSSCTIFVATEYHVWSTPYKDGDLKAENLQAIATVRTGPTANPGDGDYHSSTSVAVSGSTVYASMGSSCNGCTGESDPQRAAIVSMPLTGSSNPTVFAEHMRNAIALAVNPVSGHLWAGGAGQDDLPTYHPYEYMDDVTASAAASGGVANYGWPYCEENHVQYSTPPANWPNGCNGTVQPLVAFPAYITHIGAVFYPANPTGSYALPSAYRGSLIVSSHGSWHTPVNNCTLAPEVDSVPMNGDTPATAMTNWGVNNPTAQYTNLVTGFQPSCSNRIGRATGVAVGSQGSLFVADDGAGLVYRIRP